MPKLSTGRLVGIQSSPFRILWDPQPREVLSAFIAEFLQNVKEPWDLTLLSSVLIYTDPYADPPIFVDTNVRVRDFLAGGSDWSPEEIEEFTHWLNNNAGVREMAKDEFEMCSEVARAFQGDEPSIWDRIVSREEIKCPQIEASVPPREALKAWYPDRESLPISGGWGHSPGDAVIIAPRTMSSSGNETINGVAVEYAFAKLRMFAETKSGAAGGPLMVDWKYSLRSQCLVEIDGRKYDKLLFDVETATLDRNDEEWFGRSKHFPSEFWFQLQNA